jgi:hypothetical protein
MRALLVVAVAVVAVSCGTDDDALSPSASSAGAREVGRPSMRDADGTVRVRLRLPTYFCAPNFAFLMVADAYDAVSRVVGGRPVEIVLEDHFAAEEINIGVAARAGFVASFDGLAEQELDELRGEFLRKAMLAAQDRIVRPLLAAGVRPDELAALRLGDVPASVDKDRLRARREELGIPSADDDPLLVHVDGTTVAPDDVRVHIRPRPHGQGEHRRQRRVLPAAPDRALRPGRRLTGGPGVRSPPCASEPSSS